MFNEIKITRSSINGHFNWIRIEFYEEEGRLKLSCETESSRNEDVVVRELVDRFVEHFYEGYETAICVEQFRLRIVEGFCQLRDNDLNGNSEESMEISSQPNKNVNIMPHVI